MLSGIERFFRRTSHYDRLRYTASQHLSQEGEQDQGTRGHGHVIPGTVHVCIFIYAAALCGAVCADARRARARGRSRLTTTAHDRPFALLRTVPLLVLLSVRIASTSGMACGVCGGRGHDRRNCPNGRGVSKKKKARKVWCPADMVPVEHGGQISFLSKEEMYGAKVTCKCGGTHLYAPSSRNCSRCAALLHCCTARWSAVESR